MSRATCHAVRRICQGAAPTPRWGTGGSPMTPTSTGSRTPGAKAHPTFAIPVASVRALSNVAVEGERLSVRRDVLPCQEPLCPSEPRLSGAVLNDIGSGRRSRRSRLWKTGPRSVRAPTNGRGLPGARRPLTLCAALSEKHPVRPSPDQREGASRGKKTAYAVRGSFGTELITPLLRATAASPPRRWSVPAHPMPA